MNQLFNPYFFIVISLLLITIFAHFRALYFKKKRKRELELMNDEIKRNHLIELEKETQSRRLSKFHQKQKDYKRIVYEAVKRNPLQAPHLIQSDIHKKWFNKWFNKYK